MLVVEWKFLFSSLKLPSDSLLWLGALTILLLCQNLQASIFLGLETGLGRGMGSTQLDAFDEEREDHTDAADDGVKDPGAAEGVGERRRDGLLLVAG